MSDLFLDSSNLYEIRNILQSRGHSGEVNLEMLKKWMPSASDILFLEDRSNQLYILDSLNERFSDTLIKKESKTARMFPRYNTYANEVYIDREDLSKDIDRRRRNSKKYLSEAKGLHARVSTLESQKDSILSDRMISKKTLEM